MINILYIIAESIKNKKIMIKRKGESENGFKKTKLQVFRNTNISYQLSGVGIFFNRKSWRALFSSNHHFEIRSFVLLPRCFQVFYTSVSRTPANM